MGFYDAYRILGLALGGVLELTGRGLGVCACVCVVFKIASFRIGSK